MLCLTLCHSDLVSHNTGTNRAPLLWADLFLVYKREFNV